MTEDVVTRLLDAVEPHAAAITYSARTLKRIAHLNLSVEHDQYVHVPDQ
jgi:hypothetical protein